MILVQAVATSILASRKEMSYSYKVYILGLLIDSANGKPVNLSDDFKAQYKNDIDMEKLKLHLQLLPDACNKICKVKWHSSQGSNTSQYNL